jgi:virginiamycin B lyase
MMRLSALSCAALTVLLAAGDHHRGADAAMTVRDFPIAYPGACAQKSLLGRDLEHGTVAASGSTHEITPEISPSGTPVGAVWVTGQNYDSVVRVAADGSSQVHRIVRPGRTDCAGPHGIQFDRSGKLWVSLEFTGEIVRLAANGTVEKSFDVRYRCKDCSDPGGPHDWINPHPHGMTLSADEKTIWYTGKATGSVGRIALDTGKLETYALPTLGSVPIYIKADKRGTMWVTELLGNNIARVTQAGMVTEFKIPTANSRPIAIVPGPDGAAMWFTEEAGNKVGRIDPQGRITEFPVPKPRGEPHAILAGLAFDDKNNLWVQQYAAPGSTDPRQVDRIIEIDKAILSATPAAGVHVRMTPYDVPTVGTVMHRIILGNDGNMWFTELQTNKVGRVALGRGVSTLR